MTRIAQIPTWHVAGDWFDNCSCAVACPCTFAQAPHNGYCESVLFWHIRRGHYGDIKLDDAFGYKWQWTTNSSKHIPFDWTGP